MGFKPWIPHFGNQVPYTTAKEDAVINLKKALAKAEKEVEEAGSWKRSSSESTPAKQQE